MYRVILERGEDRSTLEYMAERADADDWAECRALAYAVVGLPNGEVVIKATKQRNGDWVLRTDGGQPAYVRITEVFEPDADGLVVGS